MRNIPMFTTENGVASLTLEKIPYTGQAYVAIRDSAEPHAFLQECVDFCRAAGADSVYAMGCAVLTAYPLYTAIISMSRKRKELPESDAILVPVRIETLSSWRDIYNEKMRDIPNAAFLTIRDSERMLQEGNCYFVQRGEEILGIGVAGEGMIKAIASVIPGGGKDTMLALCSALCTDTVSLEVASNNIPAIKLYERLDFVETETISRWYKII